MLTLYASMPAQATKHSVSVGNYYFEDDATGSRDTVVINQGEQIQFNVLRGAAAYPPHSVVIDEYHIDSKYLLPGDSYTTRPLNNPGTFLVYCRAHRDRGHETTLVIRSTATTAASPAPSSTGSSRKPAGKGAAASSSPAGIAPGQGASTPGANASPATGDLLAPVGVEKGTVTKEEKPDSRSLAGLLGRRFGGDQPWTSALWLAVAAALPIFAIAAFALGRERRRNPVRRS